ncbi:MAG: M14 family zinc carboxypeptidase [Verrucomicrobiia bacterium]
MKHIEKILAFAFLILATNLLLSEEISPNSFPKPTVLPEMKFTNSYFPGAKYDAKIPTVEQLIGFSIGERAVSPEQIYCCLTNWNKSAPEKTMLIKYAESYERRPLFYIVISSSKNIQRLNEIQEKTSRLANPSSLSESEANAIIKDLPATAWLAYTIHGTETEGSDAALAVIYHLIASEDSEVKNLLNEVVVIIDPVMNPDGRNRFVKMIEENRGAMPDIDSQDLIHSGYWPQGRGNHYLFDLNRDWLYCIHPETRGRVKEFNKWNPVFFMDAHGMWAFDTHLFSPPREPRNPNFPQTRLVWHNIFASNLAKTFDKHGLLYYSGEWHEEFFPGYGDAYTSLRGAVGILHEQASIAADGVRRPEGRILTYKESLFHHVIASMANLNTVFSNRTSLLKNLYQIRYNSMNLEKSKTYVILPDKNNSRLNDFVNTLLIHNIEVYKTLSGFKANATDRLGRQFKNFNIPSGALLVPQKQPAGALVTAMLEFDPKMSESALKDERQEILSKNRSKIYDTTAWNLTMMYDLDAVTIDNEPKVERIRITGETQLKDVSANDDNTVNPVAAIIDGTDDLSVSAAARLLELGFKVRVAEKDFQISGKNFSRGSIVITELDNRQRGKSLFSEAQKSAREIGVKTTLVDTGFGIGDLPDLGGHYFKLLEYPRIAIMGQKGFSATDYGSVWFTVEKHLGIRHSRIDDYESPDLFRYNVLILPDGSPNFNSNKINAIKEWVKAGGTLIAIAGSATMFIDDKNDFSKVRKLPEALSNVSDYEIKILKEWLSQNEKLPDNETQWSTKFVPEIKYPWQIENVPQIDEKELKKRDLWQSMFMPQGAFIAGRVDTNHWLTAGCRNYLPVLVGRQAVLMAAEGVEAPVRYGYILPKNSDEREVNHSSDKNNNQNVNQRTGWCMPIPNTVIYLRMSGLLWQEAAHRIIHGAWVTREQLGRGQIIIFATPPTFRGTERGPMRVFLNAVVFGPGCGTTIPVKP